MKREQYIEIIKYIFKRLVFICAENSEEAKAQKFWEIAKTLDDVNDDDLIKIGKMLIETCGWGDKEKDFDEGLLAGFIFHAAQNVKRFSHDKETT